jgi:hypothetical protein
LESRPSLVLALSTRCAWLDGNIWLCSELRSCAHTGVRLRSVFRVLCPSFSQKRGKQLEMLPAFSSCLQRVFSKDLCPACVNLQELEFACCSLCRWRRIPAPMHVQCSEPEAAAVRWRPLPPPPHEWCAAPWAAPFVRRRRKRPPPHSGAF